MFDQKERQSYYVLIWTSDSDVIIVEGEGDFKEKCIIIKGRREEC